MNSPDLEAIILRACDPRVGDRIIGPGSSHVTEVTSISEPNATQDLIVYFTITGSKGQHRMFLREYQWMARVAIECGKEAFHAVEDDEE